MGRGSLLFSPLLHHSSTTVLQDHTCVLNTIVGWDSTIGRWARVEGTPSDPNPNDPYAKIDSETLFRDGRLTPSITILGKYIPALHQVLQCESGSSSSF